MRDKKIENAGYDKYFVKYSAGLLLVQALEPAQPPGKYTRCMVLESENPGYPVGYRDGWQLTTGSIFTKVD